MLPNGRAHPLDRLNGAGVRSRLCQGSQAGIRAAAHWLWEISSSEPRCPCGVAGDHHRACFRATALEAPRIAPNPFSKLQSSPLCWDFQPILITDRCSRQTCHTRGRGGKWLVPLFPRQLYRKSTVPGYVALHPLPMLRSFQSMTRF